MSIKVIVLLNFMAKMRNILKRKNAKKTKAHKSNCNNLTKKQQKIKKII